MRAQGRGLMRGTMQLVKTKVSVYGYPLWIEVEELGNNTPQYALRRVEAVLKALTKDNAVQQGVPFNLTAPHNCHDPKCENA